MRLLTACFNYEISAAGTERKPARRHLRCVCCLRLRPEGAPRKLQTQQMTSEAAMKARFRNRKTS